MPLLTSANIVLAQLLEAQAS